MDLRVRSPGWRTVAEAMLLAALVTGCIPLPVPVPEVNPRYSTAQLDVVGREATTAVSIRAELGPPDLTRDDGRIWIYTWHKVSGMFIDVPIWTDEPASPGGEIVSKQYLLVLEFDATGICKARNSPRKLRTVATDPIAPAAACALRAKCRLRTRRLVSFAFLKTRAVS